MRSCLTGQPKEHCYPKSWAGSTSGQTICSLVPLDQPLLACPSAPAIISVKNTFCLRAAVRSLGSSPLLHPRKSGQLRAQGALLCLVCQWCPARPAPLLPEPALRPLDRMRKRNYLCLRIFLGLTAKNGKQHWGTLVVQWLEQPRKGTGSQKPPALPIVSLLRVGGGSQGQGSGGTECVWGMSCSEITEGFSAVSFSLKYFLPKKIFFFSSL